MDIFYHIVQDSKGTLLSNLSMEKIKEVVDYPVGFDSNNKEGNKIRREKVIVENGWIYLSICDKDITNKYFKNILISLRLYMSLYVVFVKNMLLNLKIKLGDLNIILMDIQLKFRMNLKMSFLLILIEIIGVLFCRS